MRQIALHCKCACTNTPKENSANATAAAASPKGDTASLAPANVDVTASQPASANVDVDASQPNINSLVYNVFTSTSAVANALPDKPLHTDNKATSSRSTSPAVDNILGVDTRNVSRQSYADALGSA